jgi:hypothetical protein
MGVWSRGEGRSQRRRSSMLRAAVCMYVCMYVLLSTSKNQCTIRSLCFIYLTCKWVHFSRLHCQACSQFAAGGALRRGGEGGKKIYDLLFSFLVIYRLAKYRYVFDVKGTALECNFPNGKERNLLALRLRSFNPLQEEARRIKKRRCHARQ